MVARAGVAGRAAISHGVSGARGALATPAGGQLGRASIAGRSPVSMMDSALTNPGGKRNSDQGVGLAKMSNSQVAAAEQEIRIIFRGSGEEVRRARRGT